MTEPIVTVVIPNYNGMKFLPRLLDSLARQTDSRLSVTLVDDRSTDGSVDLLRNQWPDVRLFCNERNLGFAGSCNVGLRAATTPFVALLNNDTHVDPDWLAAALRALDADGIGSVASLVLLADPPHRIDTAGDLYSVAGGAVKRLHGMPRESAAGLSPDCFSASGASAFYRRAAVEQVGYLDEKFVSYYEDVDLGFRLAWAGYRCRFAADSICFHHLSSSYSPRGWAYHFNSARNAEVVWQVDMPERCRRKYRFARSCFLALQAVNKMRQGCFRAWRAGRRAAKRDHAGIEQRRGRLPMDDIAAADAVEQRIEKDWWALHVGSRWSARRDGGASK